MHGDVNEESRGHRPLRFFALLLLAIWPLAVIETVVEACGLAPPRAAPLSVVNPQEDVMFRDEGSGFRFSSRWLWEPKPGADFSGDIVNELCRRGPIVPQRADDRFRIVTLGDSSTFGLNVKDEECFSRRLETKLRQRDGRFDVINLGCVGFSAVQALERYRGEGRSFSPRIVIVAVGAINDQFSATGGMTDRSKIALYSRLSMKIKEFCERFSTFRWLELALTPTERTSRLASIAKSTERVPLDEFERALLELDAEVAADGAKLLIVVPPRRKDAEGAFPKCVSYTERLQDLVAKRSLTHIDLFTEFRALDEADPIVRAKPESSPRFCDGFHPSPEGHELYSARLLEQLDALGWLAALQEDR